MNQQRETNRATWASSPSGRDTGPAVTNGLAHRASCSPQHEAARSGRTTRRWGIKLIVLIAVAGIVTTTSAAAEPIKKDGIVIFPDGNFSTYVGSATVSDAGYAGAANNPAASFLNAQFDYPGAFFSLAGSANAPFAINLPQPVPNLPYGPAGPNNLFAIPHPDNFPASELIFDAGAVVGGGVGLTVLDPELTGVVSGLSPEATRGAFGFVPNLPSDLGPVLGPDFAGLLDNGAAPGSTAGDLIPDQLVPLLGGASAGFTVEYGPLNTHPLAALDLQAPVFAIYADVPPTGGGLGLNTGTSTPIREDHIVQDTPAPHPPYLAGMEFTLPPPTGMTVPNTPAALAEDGIPWLNGVVDSVSATFTFFDNSDIGALPGTGPSPSSLICRISVTGLGTITGGSLFDDPNYIVDPDITFAATLFGEIFDTFVNPSGADIGPTNVPPGMSLIPDTLDFWTGLFGNPGDASFTIRVVPAPATLWLLGVAGAAPCLRLRRRHTRVRNRGKPAGPPARVAAGNLTSQKRFQQIGAGLAPDQSVLQDGSR